ncbi:hypothetical protein R1flu_021344 [Riccia fluitans]|uniref:Uncharacterized protein n=1 Tax=Riccia fluitans TaxID=41844 RepID=A0ABD1ZQT5_9MARC
MQENVITQRVMETLAANSQQPPEELVHKVTALEAKRANLEATLTRMGSVEDPRPRPIQPEVPRQKVLILDLNGLLLRLCKGVAEAERDREFGHLPVSLVGSRMVYVPRVGVSSFFGGSGDRFHAHYLDIADEPQYAPAAQGHGGAWFHAASFLPDSCK